MLKFIAYATAIVLIAGCTTPSKTDSKEGESYTGHGAESVDPALVAKYAPPALSKKVADYARRFSEIRAPGMGMVSPDGKTLYFTWPVSGVPQVWRVDGPLRFPEQMTSGSDLTTVQEITPDGKYVILGRDRGGEENPGIYLLPTGGGALVEVFHKKGVRARFDWIANDSDTIFYSANDIKPDSFAIYSYSIKNRKRDLLFSDPGVWTVSDVFGDHTFLLRRATGQSTAEFFVWNTVDRKLEPLLGQGESEEYSISFATQPREFFVLTAKFGDFKRLYLFKSGKFTPVTPEVAREIDGFSIDHRRFRLYVQWNENGYSRVEVRDPHSLKVLGIPGLKADENAYVGAQSRFGRYVTVGIESDIRPRSSFVFDWKDMKLTKWVKPSLPEIDVGQFAPASLETFPARDGQTVPMFVRRPKVCAGDPCPVIVSFHGGPEAQSRPGFSVYSQIFVAAGFVFVEPNVRGSSGYGKIYRKSDDGVKRLRVITDIEDCALHIRKAWGANGRAPRIGVYGGSYGGYSTLMAMSRFAGAYDVGVAAYGMGNLRTFLTNTAPYRRILRISEYGDPEKDKEALEELSPTTYLDRIRAPLMIIQGVNDPRVPVGEALQIHNLMKSRGIPSSLILLADEGHGAINIDSRVAQVGHTLAFFKKHLLNEKDGDLPKQP